MPHQIKWMNLKRGTEGYGSPQQGKDYETGDPIQMVRVGTDLPAMSPSKVQLESGKWGLWDSYTEFLRWLYEDNERKLNVRLLEIQRETNGEADRIRIYESAAQELAAIQGIGIRQAQGGLRTGSFGFSQQAQERARRQTGALGSRQTLGRGIFGGGLQ